VSDKKDEIQDYIYSIDKILPELSMDPYFYDSTTEYIETSFMFGIIQSFKKDKFYRNLSANLKNRLVHVVLNQYFIKFQFFFNDVNTKDYADPYFVRKILSALDCQLFDAG